MNYSEIPSPCYVVDEQLLRKNLELIKSVKERAGVEIILAFKAFAMWKIFPIFKDCGFNFTTASSLSEACLAKDEMGSLAHTYSPAYIEKEFSVIMDCSSHITFNSLSQFERFYPKTKVHKNNISCGLRVNPEISVVETDLYNPAKAGSRLGITIDLMPEKLPVGVEGLHCHVLCESSSYDLEKVLNAIEEKFGKYLPLIKWLNLGGGHLMTREGYDVEHLIRLLQNFKAKYPHLQVILEPGSAFVWQTGILRSTVVDIVESGGIKTAILDVSFACHMPDCLEMPYQPAIVGAVCRDAELRVSITENVYRMGGNSCLSGDFVGDWIFEKPLNIGDTIVFEDMMHYTTVKTTMFNGISHPSFGIWTKNNEFRLIREFAYKDYKERMS
jgi:carboxynorspermidine decarboxylase